MGELFGFIAVFVFGIFLGVNSSSVRVTPEEWTKAKEMCYSNQGIEKFITRTLDPNDVVCKNTARFTLKDEKK